MLFHNTVIPLSPLKLECPSVFIRCFRRKTVHFALLLVAILLFPSGVFAATSVGGRISTDTTWTLSGSPYIVTSSVQFYGTTSTPITLTIEPGVVVKFQTGTFLQIANGTSYPAVLNAAGTAGTPIIFTSYKDDTAGGDTNGDGSATSPAPGNWNYVSLWQGSSSSVLDHTEVRYGGGGGQGNIYVYQSSPAIQNSVITQGSNSGIYIFTQTVSSAPNILNNVIDQNVTYGIKTLSTYTATTPVAGLIQGNTVSNSGQYGMYFEGVISATIQNNQIAKGVYFTSANGSPVLTGNVISDLGSVTAQVPADILNAFLSQNTLQGIGPATTLNVIGDTITGTTTLTTQFYSYVVTSGMINVNGTTGNPATLVVQAGVRMSFASSTGISVGSSTSTPGILQVQGTLESPVLFTKSGSSAWSGISLYSGTVGAQTTLQYATIEYAGVGTSPSTGQLNISYSSPTLDHVTVQNGTASGIIMTAASSAMTAVTVNQMGADGISISGGSSGTTAPTISQATVSNAGRYGIYVNGTYGIVGGAVQGSTILSSGQYGFYFTVSYAVNTSVQNNQIGKGVYFTGSAGSPVLTGNVISDLGSVTAQVPADILNAFLSQNTLQGIGPATTLNVIGDTITGMTTLTTQFYGYVVTSGVINVNGTTGNPATLVVQAGVRMSFASSTGISVGSSTSTPGILQVQGTLESPVLFTKSGSSAWSGISLYSGTVGAQTTLQYATIEYAGVGTSPTTGQLYISYNSPTLDHVAVQNGTASGIIVTGGSPVMTSVTVSQMGADGISINGGSGTTTAPVITQAVISNAGRYGIYVNGSNWAVGGTIQGSSIQTSVSYGLYINQGAPFFLNNSIDGSLFMTNQSGLPAFTGNTIRHFSTKTGRISIGVLQQLQTQNTLLDIDPSTVLELNGTTVSTNTTLGLRWKIYNVVTGNMSLSGTSPVTLTVNPGVTMRFAASLYLGVNDKGILRAQGTSAEPILLTTLNPAPNNWRGIVFYGSAVAGASLLEYVTVDQGGKQDAAIYGTGTSFSLSHCTIRNSTLHGIQLISTDLNMTFSQVYNNSQRGLYVPTSGSSDNSRVTIRNSDFYSNTQGAILNEQSTLSVDARDTWWGDATGPGGSGPGSGNSVSTKVLYDPWLGASTTYPFAITDAYPSSSSFTQGGGTTNLTADLTQSANWTVQITDSTSTVMKSTSGSGRLINTSWDGTNTLGIPQPNGTYKFRMDATAGGSAAPVIGRIDLNNNLPVAQITAPAPDQLIVIPAVDITGTASASSFTSYSVEVGLGTSPFQFMTLTNASPGPVVDGALATWTVQSNPPSSIYQIRLKVTGNGGATAEATRFVRIDHVPPLQPELSQPASPTTTQPITVTGTAEENTTVELYVNDQAAGEATATADGAFTFTDVALTLGSNSFKARARDSANNTGSFSDKKTVVYMPAGEGLIHILSPADGSTVYK